MFCRNYCIRGKINSHVSATYTAAIIKDVYYSYKFTVISLILRQIDVRVFVSLFARACV